MQRKLNRKWIGLLLLLSGFTNQALFAEESDGIRVQYKVGDGTYIGDGSDTDTFSVPRAEIRMDGFTLEKKLKYSFEMNLATRNRATTESTTGYFDLVRDIGANNFNRNNKSLLTGIRLEVPFVGSYDYSEADPSNSEGQNFGMGVAYAFNENRAATQNSTIAAFTKAHHATLDFGYKHKGLSFRWEKDMESNFRPITRCS